MTNGGVRKVSEKVYLLGDPYYQVYLIKGKNCALVETGLSYTVPKVVDQLAELGISPEEISYLVITHAHFDHTCGAFGLQKTFPYLQTIASPVTAKVLAKEKVVASHFVEDKAVVETLLGKAVIDEHYDISFRPPATINVDLIMNEGDTLDLGEGCNLHFYSTPGHSPCSMSVYLPLGQVFFPSDCLGYPFKNKDIFPMYFSGLSEYLNSIEKVSGFESSILAFPQSPIMPGEIKIREFINRSLKITEQVHDFIINNYRRGRDSEDISQELFPRFYLDGMAIQSKSIIKVCTELIVRRSLEAENII
ncbi:MAG: MBL fold metallo-hydrolase [Desulfitobacteriaceae bacterium]|nr:MBL fold metallo-hydrolase [Desulfitobacteriaceae bacterium]MDD4347007.1 MBL fold metallo-hydrolase [Desulfitobacteriaceae bacterium]MDD4401728.1 MBL fold metallo-hydrolase [Desulfitobacteriaceae bacterium]